MVQPASAIPQPAAVGRKESACTVRTPTETSPSKEGFSKVDRGLRGKELRIICVGLSFF
jgi:hypothetical protein